MTWAELLAALKRPLPLLAVLGCMLGAALIGGAAGTDKTLFGPITAAWVQAIGSIAAIVGVVWVDRSVAARASRQRDTERAAEISLRHRAVSSCSSGVHALAEVLAKPFPVNDMDRALVAITKRAMRARRHLKRLIDHGVVIAEVEGLQLFVDDAMEELPEIIERFDLSPPYKANAEAAILLTALGAKIEAVVLEHRMGVHDDQPI